MLCEVLNESGLQRTIQTAEESYMGRFEPGDVVLDVRKLEPTSVGSSMYEYTDKKFPVFVEDIRKRKMQDYLEKVDTTRRSARVAGTTSTGAPSQREVFLLSAEGKSMLLRLTASDSSIGDRRDLRRISGRDT